MITKIRKTRLRTLLSRGSWILKTINTLSLSSQSTCSTVLGHPVDASFRRPNLCTAKYSGIKLFTRIYGPLCALPLAKRQLICLFYPDAASSPRPASERPPVNRQIRLDSLGGRHILKMILFRRQKG